MGKFKTNTNRITLVKEKGSIEFFKTYAFLLVELDKEAYSEDIYLSGTKIARRLIQLAYEEDKNLFNLSFTRLSSSNGYLFAINKEYVSFLKENIPQTDDYKNYLRLSDLTYDDINESDLINILLVNMVKNAYKIPTGCEFENDICVVDGFYLVNNKGSSYYLADGKINDNMLNKRIDVFKIHVRNGLLFCNAVSMYGEKDVEKSKKYKNLKITEKDVISSSGYYPVLFKNDVFNYEFDDEMLNENFNLFRNSDYLLLGNVSNTGKFSFKHYNRSNKKAKSTALMFDSGSEKKGVNVNWASKSHAIYLTIFYFNQFYKGQFSLELEEIDIFKEFESTEEAVGKYHKARLKLYDDEFERAKAIVLENGYSFACEGLKPSDTIIADSLESCINNIFDIKSEGKFKGSNENSPYKFVFIHDNDKDSLVTDKKLELQHIALDDMDKDAVDRLSLDIINKNKDENIKDNEDTKKKKDNLKIAMRSKIQKCILEMAIKMMVKNNQIFDKFPENLLFLYAKKNTDEDKYDYITLYRNERSTFVEIVDYEKVLELYENVKVVNDKKHDVGDGYYIIDKENNDIYEIKKTDRIALPKEPKDFISENLRGWNRQSSCKINSIASLYSISWNYDYDGINYYVGEDKHPSNSIASFPNEYKLINVTKPYLIEKERENILAWYLPLLKNNFVRLSNFSVYPWPFKWMSEYLTDFLYRKTEELKELGNKPIPLTFFREY